MNGAPGEQRRGKTEFALRAAMNQQEGRNQERFHEPESVVAQARGGEGPEAGSGEEAEADEAEGAGVVEAELTGFGIMRGAGVVESDGHVAEVAGDEGRAVGEAANAAEAGDLVGGDEGDERGKGHLRKTAGKQAGEKEYGYLKREAVEAGAAAETIADEAGGCDSAEEGTERGEMTDGLKAVVSHERDAEEDDVAGHGVGEDVAVVEIDEGVEQASGGGEEHGGQEGFGGFGLSCWRHSRR